MEHRPKQTAAILYRYAGNMENDMIGSAVLISITDTASVSCFAISAIHLSGHCAREGAAARLDSRPLAYQYEVSA